MIYSVGDNFKNAEVKIAQCILASFLRTPPTPYTNLYEKSCNFRWIAMTYISELLILSHIFILFEGKGRYQKG